MVVTRGLGVLFCCCFVCFFFIFVCAVIEHDWGSQNQASLAIAFAKFHDNAC